jgi:putative SOS response-associated peptidase YedK
MCGKVAAKASWAESTRIIETLTGTALGDNGHDGMQERAEDVTRSNDHDVTFRVMSVVPVIVWDAQAKTRKVAAMRWGFPSRDDPRRPDPIHARAETIDSKPTFRDAFLDGQRGILLVKTFNEAPDNGIQHVIMPGDLERVGIAMLWRRFGDILACVMATVPANQLIAGLPTDRMPAILTDDDEAAIWLGETSAPHDRIKAGLKTVEGVRWTMAPEQRAAKPRRRPTVSDPGGLF